MADGILTPCNVARSWHWFRQVTAPCNVACGSGVMTLNSPSGSRPTLQRYRWLWDDMSLNSPGGSTLQCGRWLWDDIPLNSPKRSPYWNSTSGFNFGHITAVDMSFCTKSDHPRQKKMTSCRFSRWRISAILDFRASVMGSLKSLCTTSYRSSIDTKALNCLVFEKIAFLYFGERQTDEQMDMPVAWSRSRCRERRLNNQTDCFCSQFDDFIMPVVFCKYSVEDYDAQLEWNCKYFTQKTQRDLQSCIVFIYSSLLFIIFVHYLCATV